MSDHWKTLARLLGAPGAADPPKPKTKPTPAPAKTPAAKTPPADTPTRDAPAANTPTGKAGELPPALPGFGATAAAEEPRAPREPQTSGAQPSGAQPSGDVDDIFSGFGKPRERQRSEASPSRESSQRESAAARPAESRPAESRGEESPRRSAAAELFSEPIRDEGPSSWDELVDQLGVPAAPAPPPRLADSEPLETAEPKSTATRPSRASSGPEKSSRPTASAKSTGGGFGAGLIESDVAEAADLEPTLAEEKPPQRAEAAKPPRAPAAAESSSESTRASESGESDPLAELGAEGWGTPRRRASAERRPAEEPQRQREDRPSSRADASREATREERGRGAERPQEERRERGGRGERTPRSEDSPAAERGETESPRSEEAGGRPPRRGRRRGQRQRMTEDQIGWEDESQTPSAARRSRDSDSDIEDDIPSGFGVLDADEELEEASLIDEAPTPLDDEEGESEEGESQPRRRRRRGRRRRGASADAATESGSPAGRSGADLEEEGGEVPSSGGKSEFDDDHEDDDEAAALRRSRRGRRRRGAPAEAEPGVGEDTPRSSNYGAEADAGEEDEVLRNTQRNIPTWMDTVSLLVDANLESRKGGSSRGGGGRSRGRGRD